MIDNYNDLFNDILRVESPILKLIRKYKSEQYTAGFDVAANLIGLAECMEHEITEFWGRDPDPFDERTPRRVPVAGVYAQIYDDLLEETEFILNLTLKYLLTRDEVEDYMILTLRFLCSIIYCCGLSTVTIFEPDVTERFYEKIFDLAQSNVSSLNVYATYIVGHITKEDDQVIPQRKVSFLNLIASTMNRLEQLNQISGGNSNPQTYQNDSSSDDNQNGNIQELSMHQISGVWNLAHPMTEATQQRLLLYFLRHVAEFEALMPIIYTNGILALISSWLRSERHNDPRLTYEALRVLMKLLVHRVIYVEFFDRIEGITLLLGVPRHTIAVNAVSFCLYNLFYSGEIVEKVIQLPQNYLEDLMKTVLWIIEKCHPSARCYGMLCIQHFVSKPNMLRIFEKLNGPRHILNLFTILPNMLGDAQGKNSSIYFEFLKTTLNTMKTYLEQSLITWSLGADTNENTGLLAFPCESEALFPKNVVNYIPLAIKLQTWKHAYLIDSSDVIKVIYSKTGFFTDAFSNFHETINSILDILSLLCISNKFVKKCFEFSESDTNSAIKTIFDVLARKPKGVSANHMNSLKSILFFMGVLCCRPLQGARNSTQMNKSTRKRKLDEFDRSANVEKSEKIRITDQGTVNKISSSSIVNITAPVNFHQELQTKLWSLMRSYNAIPKLLKILEIPWSPLDMFAIRTWVCHVLSGLTRCNDILVILRKLPTFNKGIIEGMMNESVTPERAGEHVEFCTIARRLMKDLRGDSSTDKISDLRPDQIRKREIVASTQIRWDNQELLNIIHNHLEQSGLVDVADYLRRRVNLKIHDRGSISLYEDAEKAFYRLPKTPKRITDRNISTSTPKPISNDLVGLRPKLFCDSINQTSITSTYTPPTIPKPSRLNEIVESFLRYQHAECKNPIGICPKFSLYSEHVCPSIDEMVKPNNIYHYLNKRSYDHGRNSTSNRMLRYHVHRTFKPKVVLTESNVFDEDRFAEAFCYARDLGEGLFFSSENFQIAFTDVNLSQTTVEVGEVDHMVSNLENSKDGRLLLVSSQFSRRDPGPVILFNVATRCTDPARMMKQYDYPFSGYAEFGKSDDTKFIVTQDKTAQIVDVETGTKIFTCFNAEDNDGNVRKAVNRATFNYTDNLVLNYGALWDIRCSSRSSSTVKNYQHKFDALEDIVSGVFHPNGMDVIIGSAVWDVRKYQFVNNLPSLKSSRVIFNDRGDFFYTYRDTYNPYHSNSTVREDNIFQCYDSRDYRVVATINTNKIIMGMAIDPNDLGIAVMETNDDCQYNAQCRVFNIGERWSANSANELEEECENSYDDDVDDSDPDMIGNDGLTDFMFHTDTENSSDDDISGETVEENGIISVSESDNSSDSTTIFDGEDDEDNTEEFSDSDDSIYDSDSDF